MLWESAKAFPRQVSLDLDHRLHMPAAICGRLGSLLAFRGRIPPLGTFRVMPPLTPAYPRPVGSCQDDFRIPLVLICATEVLCSVGSSTVAWHGKLSCVRHRPAFR